MKAFQENLTKLEGADTQVLGVSVDSPFANHAFAQQNGVTFPLLGDMDLKAIKAYGLDKEVKIGGVPMVTARRATFLIDKEGKVVEEQVDSVVKYILGGKVSTDTRQVLMTGENPMLAKGGAANDANPDSNLPMMGGLGGLGHRILPVAHVRQATIRGRPVIVSPSSSGARGGTG